MGMIMVYFVTIALEITLYNVSAQKVETQVSYMIISIIYFVYEISYFRVNYYSMIGTTVAGIMRPRNSSSSSK